MKLRCRVLALAGVLLALAGCVHQAGLVICGRAGSPVVGEVAGGYRPSGDVQQLTGDYRAAAASLQQVMALNRDLDDRSTQAWVLNELGVLKQLAGAPAPNPTKRARWGDVREKGSGQCGTVTRCVTSMTA